MSKNAWAFAGVAALALLVCFIPLLQGIAGLVLTAGDGSFVVGAAPGVRVAHDEIEKTESTPAPHVMAPQQAVWDALSLAASRVGE